MGKKDKRELADMFKALGDPTRLKIYLFLRGRCWPNAADGSEEKWIESGPTVSEVCTKVTGSKKITSKVSQHLKELRLSGLVTIERRGKNMICGINQQAINALISQLNCTDEVEAVAPELVVSIEPELVEASASPSAAPNVDDAPTVEAEPIKISKKNVKAKMQELPVIEVELVRSRRKGKAQVSRNEPPAPAA